jgi:ABC-type branched-subunit amino acid transport system substrate-binding protein
MDIDRRRFIATSGAATIAGLSGCLGGDDGDGDGSNGSDGGDGGDDGGDDTTTEPSGGGDSSGEISVGVLLPFSGDYAWVGANVLPTVNMIAEEINEQGGIDGDTINVIQGDTEGSPDASLSAAQKLIDVDEVVGIIGPTSITMSAVFDTFVENEVPIVTPTAGTTSLDDRGGEYVYRTVPSDALGGRAIAYAARNGDVNGEQDYGNMAMMVGNEEVFQSFKEPIANSFEEFGGQIVEQIDFRTGKSSYSSEVGTMIDADPEITALTGSKDDSIKIMESAFQAGYDGNWFVTQDQTTDVFLEESENAATNGIFGIESAPFQKAQEAGRIEAFKQRHVEYADEEPKLFARNAYDAMNVFGLALKVTAMSDAEVTGANVAGNIRTVANPSEQTATSYTDGAEALETGADVDYQGLVGPIDFDENGDVTAPFNILQAQDGSWSQVANIPPSDLQ